MGIVRNIRDGLANAITGAGGRGDPRTANGYAFVPLSEIQIAAAFRGSGLIRKIISIPADDSVREWREWKGDAGDLSGLYAEEKRLGIPQKVHLAEINRGLGGGAFILGLPGIPSLPAPKPGRGALSYVHVVTRWQLSAQDWVDDPLDPLFGGPRMWRMQSTRGEVLIHPSRVITFRGDPIPNIAGTSQEDIYWGESRVQRVLDAAQDADSARQSFANLIQKARLTRLGIPGLSRILADGGEADVQKRLAMIVQGESLLNASIYDSGNEDGKDAEKIDDIHYNFTGMKDVMEAFGLWLCAIADIPSTRLLGRAPEGMNSSGDSQQKDWAKKIRAHQTLQMMPSLDQLDAYLIPSALGTTPAGIWSEFPPLDLPTEAEVATRFKTEMEAIEKLQNTATIPDASFAEAVQSKMIEEGYLPGLEQALAKVPEAERYGIEQDVPVEEPILLAANDKRGGYVGPGDYRIGDGSREAFHDATPRPLYVRRDLKPASAKALIAWAKANGFTTTLDASDMHVTVLYSKTPVDPMKMGETWGNEEDGGLTVKAGGPRALERFGEGAVVLQFASHDFDEYLPHVTITYDAPEGLDLEAIKPFTGELRFGPEIFEPLDLDWKSKIGEA